MNPSDPGYYRAGRKEVRAWPETDPVPEVLSTDPLPSWRVRPAPVGALLADAINAGWVARAGYSTGPARAVRIGTYKQVETWGVWAGPHPETRWRFAAMYERTKGGTYAWARTRIWLPTHPRVFTHATVTDLKAFIAARGDVGPAWFKAVHARVEQQAANAKLRAKTATRKAKEGAS